MKKLLATLLLAALAVSSAVPALAQEDTQVSRKFLHVAAGTGISYTVTQLTKKPKLGLLAGISSGVAKELYDHQTSNEPISGNIRDIAITAAGPVVIYLITRHIFRKNKGEIR